MTPELPAVCKPTEVVSPPSHPPAALPTVIPSEAGNQTDPYPNPNPKPDKLSSFLQFLDEAENSHEGDGTSRTANSVSSYCVSGTRTTLEGF